MDEQTLPLFILLVSLAVYILFLITQNNVLKAIRPHNRKMSPGEVWLQLIPLFNLIWVFVVVIRISDSIRQEFRDRQENAFLGLADSNVIEEANSRPAYGIGMAYAILVACFAALTMATDPTEALALRSMLSLAFLTCWIIYWVKLHEYKKKLSQLRD
jgi:hypothetical protein